MGRDSSQLKVISPDNNLARGTLARENYGSAVDSAGINAYRTVSPRDPRRSEAFRPADESHRSEAVLLVPPPGKKC